MLRTFTLILFILSLSGNLYSQDSTANDNSSVLITVSSKGSSIEDLRLNASRLAIEQAFGTFISSNTQILNDNLVRDEIISVSNGNVRKFEIIDEKKDLSGSYIGSYKVLVSVNQLKNFCTAKGIKIEFAGGVFTKNIKLQELYENSELKAIWNTLFILNPILNKSFDYKATASDPKAIEGTKDFKVNFLIDCYANENHQFVFDYLANVLKGLSLSEEERKTYRNLNKKIWICRINGQEYYLRNNRSFIVLNTFFDEIKWIQRRFVITDGVKNLVGTFAMFDTYGGNNRGNPYFKINKVSGAEHDFHDTVRSDEPVLKGEVDRYSGFEDLSMFEKIKENFIPGHFQYNYDSYIIDGICFRSRNTNNKLKTFDVSITYALSELEKISNFTVDHSSKTSRLSQWYDGGSIFYEDSNYVLIKPIGERPFFSFEIQQDCYGCERNCPDLRLCPIEKDDLTRIIGDVFKKTYTDTLIGTGFENTKKISKICDTILSPFKYILSKTINTYSDWFIPSKIEAFHLIEYWRKYLQIPYDISSNVMTSSLSKGKEYNDDWDSFIQIQEFDFRNENLSVYYQPIKVLSLQLFNDFRTYFHPIRMEKKK